MRHRRGEGEKEGGIGTVLVDAEEGGAAQQQWHRSASECAEAPRRGAESPEGRRWGCARLGSARRGEVGCGPVGTVLQQQQCAARVGILGLF